jgi:RNA polymerase sigma factor (sigma-70 family)
MAQDTELLLRYADFKSEPAFAQFVDRYVSLVYSAALRRTNGDVHLAEDVAQLVFSSVAREPRTVARHPVPAGWLYVATRNAAANIMRAEKRRKAREMEASSMEHDPSELGSAQDTDKLREQLTLAIDSLDEDDRNAVLLRFFRGSPFSEIGGTLLISEDTARKRVERALEKLRSVLSKRGITSTSAALAAALDVQAGASVPVGLAARISGQSLSAVVPRSLFTNSSSMTRFKLATAIAVGVAGLFIVWHRSLGGVDIQSKSTTASIPQVVKMTTPSVQPTSLANLGDPSSDSNGGQAQVGKDLSSDHVQLQILSSATENIRTGSLGVNVSLSPVGMLESRVQAGRITITSALDDKGALLTQETTNKFYTVSVGRIDDSRDLTSREPASFSLWGLSKDSKELVSVLGVLELVIPDLDPNSTVTVDNISEKFGSGVRSEVLAAAGVTISVFDKRAAETAAANKIPGGPQEYDSGPFFGDMPKRPAVFPRPKMEMEDGDIAVAIDDPNDRLIGIEIEAADGSPLNYNHGGNYHSSGLPGKPGRRFDTYHIGAALPSNARLVCWLLTPKAVLKIPFQIDRLPIPASSAPRNLGMITVQVAAAQAATKNALDYDNSHAAAKSSESASGTTDRIAQLWSDVPEYVAAIKSDIKYKNLPKLISSIAPAPAAGTIFPPHGLVNVTVSFFVDPAGNVEAARVLDSNNSAFNIPAISAVLQWKFRPAETEKGPALVMVVVPFVFNPTAPVPLNTSPETN